MHWRSDSVRLCPREISAAKRLQIKIPADKSDRKVYPTPSYYLYCSLTTFSTISPALRNAKPVFFAVRA